MDCGICSVERSSPDDPTRARRTGLIAAAISAIMLPFITFASLWMSETLFTALFISSLVVALRWVRQPRLGVAALLGVLLGLATLTRSASLAALPLLVVWMITSRPRTARLRPRVWGTVVCVLLTCATIAPWTIRNYMAYGGLIPVETGLSYNLWVFNEPRETMGDIHRTLEAIPESGRSRRLCYRERHGATTRRSGDPGS